MSRVDAQLARMNGRLAARMGSAVTYRRGRGSAVQEIEPAAVRSPREYGVEAGDGAVETMQSDDWLIVAAELAALGVPQAGDQIETEAGDVYEVLGIPGRNCWEWSGPARYRVHSKRIAPQVTP